LPSTNRIDIASSAGRILSSGHAASWTFLGRIMEIEVPRAADSHAMRSQSAAVGTRPARDVRCSKILSTLLISCHDAGFAFRFGSLIDKCSKR
jgi:hypothetical protein